MAAPNSVRLYLVIKDAALNFPSSYDFLEKFGIEPVEEDESINLFRYIKSSQSGEVEIDISFSEIMKSFQITLRISGREISTVSSESVRSIKFFSDNSGDGLHVIFDINKAVSEVRVVFEPDISFRWWTLSNA